jgi:hypothetical protein
VEGLELQSTLYSNVYGGFRQRQFLSIAKKRTIDMVWKVALMDTRQSYKETLTQGIDTYLGTEKRMASH